jgi:hypothetical protein
VAAARQCGKTVAEREDWWRPRTERPPELSLRARLSRVRGINNDSSELVGAERNRTECQMGNMATDQQTAAR